MPGRPACPTRRRRITHTHTCGTPAWLPPTQKGRCWRPHETAPVHQPSPPSKDGQCGKPDASLTGSTNNRSARSPRPKPEGPARDIPILGPRTGTTRSEPRVLASAGASSRQKEPGPRPASTCPTQPPSKAGATAPSLGEGTTATGRPTRAPRATGPDESRRTNAAPRGTPERHAAGHNHGTRTGAKERQPPGAANLGSVHNTQRTAAQEKVSGTAGPPRPHPATTASGKRAPAARPKGREVGGGGAPVPVRPTPRHEAPPPGALVPPQQRAKPARKSARCGVGDESLRPHPLRPQPVGSGPRPHAQKDEWSGVGDRPTPDAPHSSKRRPPRAPSCRPHSAQSQHARVRAVGLVTGPQTRNPCARSQWVVAPGRTPKRTSGRGWESAQPPTPHTKARGAPPGTLMSPPQGAKLARKSARCGVGGGSPRQHPPQPQPVDSGPRAHARRDEWSGVGERPTPDGPQPGKRRPPPEHRHATPTARKASSQERALWGW